MASKAMEYIKQTLTLLERPWLALIKKFHIDHFFTFPYLQVQIVFQLDQIVFCLTKSVCNEMGLAFLFWTTVSKFPNCIGIYTKSFWYYDISWRKEN